MIPLTCICQIIPGIQVDMRLFKKLHSGSKGLKISRNTKIIISNKNKY